MVSGSSHPLLGPCGRLLNGDGAAGLLPTREAVRAAWAARGGLCLVPCWEASCEGGTATPSSQVRT